MKTLLLLLFVCLSSIVYAQDTLNFEFEDKRIVGVIKIYETDDEKYLTRVSYVDSTSLKYGGFTLYDIVIRSYFNTFPILYPDLMVQAIKDNLLRFREEYEQLPKE
jgi:hypothetical protein